MNQKALAKESKGFIHLINSGAACIDACGEAKDENGNGVIKPFWEMTEKDQKACLDATEWCPADNGYFRGGGFSSRFLTNSEMPVTMVRLNLVKGLGPVLQIAEGWTVKLPDEVSDKLWKRTDYTWPCTWFAPRLTGEGAFKSAYDVMNNWGANHGAISYGHIGADSLHYALCSEFLYACITFLKIKSSVLLLGMLLVWIKKVKTIELAKTMVLYINNQNIIQINWRSLLLWLTKEIKETNM